MCIQHDRRLNAAITIKLGNKTTAAMNRAVINTIKRSLVNGIHTLYKTIRELVPVNSAVMVATYASLIGKESPKK